MDRNHGLGMAFPNNFLWGTSTSSHQIEGNNINNDWWDAEQRGLTLYKSGKACDSYNRYEEDFDLAKAMHNNAHRFSIEWSRIEPKEGEFNQEEIEHYRKVLQALRARSIEPFVCLHQFTNPIWFAEKYGWTNKKAPEYFERYVKYVTSHLGNEATYWMTINEPRGIAAGWYLSGGNPPFHKNDFLGYFLCLQNMVNAHRRAYRILHKYNPRAQVCVANVYDYFEPAGRGLSRLINYLSVFVWRYLTNELFLDRIRKHQDFIGVNYYRHRKVSLFKGAYEEGQERSDLGWVIYPEGIYHVAKQAHERYKKPIYITENGIADADDDQRPDFILNHLKWVYKAIEDGVDIRGYFYWSLLDNFEWGVGFTKGFGLVKVNFETLERRMRPSGRLYREICKNNAI